MGEIVGRLGGPGEPREPEATAPEFHADPRGARWVRRRTAAAVAALTTVVDTQFRATSVTSATVASEDPFLMLVSLELDGQFADWLVHSGMFGLSFLSWRDQLLADRFAGLAPRVSTSFEGVPFVTARTGAPLISTSISWVDCEVVDTFTAGDHLCFVGKAVAVGQGTGDESEPLMYYLNRYRRV